VLGGFGSGVSSLTLLRRRSLAGLLSGLKLDRLIVRELDCVEQDHGFLHGLAASAHALGLLVLADGIETELQCQRLLDAGCDQGAGPWMGEPEAAAQWAHRRRTTSSKDGSLAFAQPR
jgi:EAL domain-containing protein (putative c-di-GMP-specific phosphodiesterase class I)